MGDVDLVELVKRCAAIETEALLALTPAVAADAVEGFFHSQETFPYFTHRVTGFGVDDESEQFDTTDVTVVIRLVIGHLQQGYFGEPETTLYRYIPQVVRTFNRRAYLQSGVYAKPMKYLKYARATGGTFSAFRNTGIDANQVGTEFTLRAHFITAIEQDYL